MNNNQQYFNFSVELFNLPFYVGSNKKLNSNITNVLYQTGLCFRMLFEQKTYKKNNIGFTIGCSFNNNFNYFANSKINTLLLNGKSLSFMKHINNYHYYLDICVNNGNIVNFIGTKFKLCLYQKYCNGMFIYNIINTNCFLNIGGEYVFYLNFINNKHFINIGIMFKYWYSFVSFVCNNFLNTVTFFVPMFYCDKNIPFCLSKLFNSQCSAMGLNYYTMFIINFKMFEFWCD